MYLGVRVIWENWAQIPQIMSTRDTQKVIRNFQHYISHEMRSYSSARAIWGLSYTWFKLSGVLEQFGWNWAPAPQFFVNCQNLSSWDMWNKELKTLDFFPCDSVLDLVVFGCFPPNCPNAEYPENRYNSIIRWSWQKSKTSFDVKCGTEHYGLL